MVTFGFIFGSKFWLFLALAIIFLKHSNGSCGMKTKKSKQSKDELPSGDEVPQTPSYDEKDLVPDGQSGF